MSNGQPCRYDSAFGCYSYQVLAGGKGADIQIFGFQIITV
jgi:hypothetical protein